MLIIALMHSKMEICKFQEIDLEALRVMNFCYDVAKEVLNIMQKKILVATSQYPYLVQTICLCQILQQNRKLMDAVVDELVRKKSLTKQEFFNLVELHGVIKPMPPSILRHQGCQACTVSRNVGAPE